MSAILLREGVSERRLAYEMSGRVLDDGMPKRVLWANYVRLRDMYVQRLLEIASLKRRIALLEHKRIKKYR